MTRPRIELVARAICCAEWGADRGWTKERIARQFPHCDCVAWKDHLLAAENAISALEGTQPPDLRKGPEDRRTPDYLKPQIDNLNRIMQEHAGKGAPEGANKEQEGDQYSHAHRRVYDIWGGRSHRRGRVGGNSYMLMNNWRGHFRLGDPAQYRHRRASDPAPYTGTNGASPQAEQDAARISAPEISAAVKKIGGEVLRHQWLMTSYTHEQCAENVFKAMYQEMLSEQGK